MQNEELSILFPVGNIEKEIPAILGFEKDQTKDVSAEFIIVDMGSTDRTVLCAVQAIKELGLSGFVIQNGRSNVPAALNTAIRKAGGKYLAFLFARRLYGGFFRQYLDAADRSGADFVYGCRVNEEIRAAERRSVSSVVHQPDGGALLLRMLEKGTVPDIASVMVRREFLGEQRLFFDDCCEFGYAEEFILRCLLCSGTATQAPAIPVRNRALELNRNKQKPVGKAVFERVSAMLRVLETAKNRYGDNAGLLRTLQKDQLPAVVMGAVGVALREGTNYRDIKAYLNETGYDRLLTTDRRTNPDLRRRILLWKIMPRFY